MGTIAAELESVGIASGRLAGGPIAAQGELLESRAWSTMKVPVAVAALAAGRADCVAVEAALTRSDNEAALALWRGLDDAAARVEQLLRLAGDSETVLEREPDPRGWSSFGRTRWSLVAAARFYRALARGELLGADDTRRVLAAMERVVPEQRWGLGEIRWAAPVRLKGGWGPSEAPEGGYELIQVALAGPAVIALAATAPDFESAKRLASRHVPQHPNALQLRAPGDR